MVEFIVSLPYVPANSTRWYRLPSVRVTEPARVRVVLTKEVVTVLDPIVPVPFVTGVPLGLPALSVSIRNEKVALGDAIFLIAKLNVVPATPVPNTGKDIRVLAATSHKRFSVLPMNEATFLLSEVLSVPATEPAVIVPLVKTTGYVQPVYCVIV